MSWEWVDGYDNTTYTDDMIFEVDYATKKVQKIVGQTLISGENRSQFIRFVMNRYYDGVDLSTKNIQIIYLTETNYSDINAAVCVERSDDQIRFGWLVPAEACYDVGTTTFSIEFVGDNYTLKTRAYDLEVVDGLNGGEVVPEPTDKAWYIELQERCDYVLNKATEAKDAAATSAENAATSETNAATSETNAATSETNAQTYANLARGAAYGSPLTANTASAMTDNTRVYVYTGSETGYTAGHWYYWNGSAWADGGVYNSVAVSTDETLTVEGKPADGKTVGDLLLPAVNDITSLKEDLNDITDYGAMLIDNSYVNHTNGNIGTLNNISVAVISSVVPNMIVHYNYKFVNPDVRGLAFYDKFGAYISGYQVSTTTQEITVPESACTLKATVNKLSDVIIGGYNVLISDISNNIEDMDARVVNLEENRFEIIPTWNSGYYVNNVAKKLTPLAAFRYSDLIELKAGDGIIVIDAYSKTANVVDMLSKWSINSNNEEVYLASLYPFPAAGYSDSTVYRATEAKEYVRICFQVVGHSSEKIKVFKYNAGASALSDIVNANSEAIKKWSITPSISMFERVGFCGDSYVKAQLWRGRGDVIGDRPLLSWGADIGRMDGITADIYASSGADTNTFQTRADCLPALLASANPCGLYVFCMGINDSSYVTTGTLNDITEYEDWHDYPNTFYGNYGKIIEQVLAYSPASKLIIMTPYHPRYNDKYLVPIQEITTHYGIAMINTKDSALCSSINFENLLVGGHPTATLHSAMARDISVLIGKCMMNNYDYFKTYAGI